MRLSPPKMITWIIAVVLGVLGILINYGSLSLGGLDAFLLVTIGFALLALATVIDGL